MLSNTFLTLLSVASIAQSLPLDDLSSPILETRAVGGVVTGPLATSDASSAGAPGADAYNLYSGDGSTWPPQSKWVSFSSMFTANTPLMTTSCTNLGVTPNTSPSEVADIHTGILAASAASGVDPRFVLAIIMQESKGCVRVKTTNYGVENPGLMQSHAGVGCTTSPCPSSTISQMISDGTAGTAAGDGLAQCLNQANTAGGEGAQAFYWAARIYNSGSYAAGGTALEGGIATHCYATDVANRLTGWVSAASTCTFDGGA